MTEKIISISQKEIIEKIFELDDHADESKVIPLDEAISRYVRPGASIFIGWNANAIICELMRQFRRTKPGFNIIMTMTWDQSLNLVHCGLVKKLTTTSCSYLHPNPSPSPVIQRAFKEQTIEIENWSLYSIQQRLMAGALDVGFMPTKSIAGSDMSVDNSSCFTEIVDPFDSNKRIGVVKALNSEISMVHGLAADEYGNTILSPVSEDTQWGVKANREGVIVTVEKLVSPDFIRRNAASVSIPGYLVKSVSVCPFGAHPEGLYSNLDEVDGYKEDYEFMLEQRAVSTEKGKLDEWLDKWVFGAKGHDDYLKRLGKIRLSSLKMGIEGQDCELQAGTLFKGISLSNACSTAEMMVVAAARMICEKVKENKYHTLLAGLGTCGLAAWLAFYRLRTEGYGVELVLGSGIFGYKPRPGNPMLLNVANAFTAKMLIDTSDMYGYYISGSNANCLSVIGAAQIDRLGNINSTLIKPDTYIIGSGGGNDNACGASEVLVVAAQSRRRCVEAVDYITSPGAKVRTLVTNMGIFKKNEAGVFVLTHYLPGTESASSEASINKIIENCGWELEISSHLNAIDVPTDHELTILRMLDPQGYLLKD